MASVRRLPNFKKGEDANLNRSPFVVSLRLVPTRRTSKCQAEKASALIDMHTGPGVRAREVTKSTGGG